MNGALYTLYEINRKPASFATVLPLYSSVIKLLFYAHGTPHLWYGRVESFTARVVVYSEASETKS
jgi:hypothetical protein